MPTKSMHELQADGVTIPAPLVTSNWVSPVEAITPHPRYTRPLTAVAHDSLAAGIAAVTDELEPGEVLLAHETTREDAEVILDEGFDADRTGSAPIREQAVFGWLHDTDVGYLRDANQMEADTVVLYAVHRDNVFVSSYETSARQVVNGVIDARTYEDTHVLVYTDYESLHWEHAPAVDHLEYTPESLLPSR